MATMSNITSRPLLRHPRLRIRPALAPSRPALHLGRALRHSRRPTRMIWSRYPHSDFSRATLSAWPTTRSFCIRVRHDQDRRRICARTATPRAVTRATRRVSIKFGSGSTMDTMTMMTSSTTRKKGSTTKTRTAVVVMKTMLLRRRVVFASVE